MKAKDLMIGDWVRNKFQSRIFRVLNVGENYVGEKYEDGMIEGHKEQYLEPIPLTEKILFDSGFVHLENGVYTNIYALNVSGESDKEDYFYFSVNGKMENPDSIKIMFIPYSRTFWLDLIIRSCYVHELQHILRLCGIEKEIVIK